MTRPTAAVVIPCLNEEETIGPLVTEVRLMGDDAMLPVWLIDIYVVDNGSTDATADRAAEAGARVVPEPRRGYGRACLSGVQAAGEVDLIVLMDGDGADDPAALPRLLAPLLAGDADLVIGSRTMGTAAPGSLTPQQRAGNRVAALLLRLLYGVRVTDIGPFRVIRQSALAALGMREMTYGWSVEMIARTAKAGLRVTEVPVDYRPRAGGVSKVSGNPRTSLKAGFRMIGAILRARRGPVPTVRGTTP